MTSFHPTLAAIFPHPLLPALSFTVILCSGLCAQPSPLHLVHPFVGTDGHGHTFPGATVPFGMVQLSPDTRTEGWDACGGYHYSDSTILGFSHTHLSGTGIPDYGDVLILPTTRAPEKRIRQSFSHRQETASPGYYRVVFTNDSILAELTATARVGVHRYTFPTSPLATILIDLRHGLGPDRVTDSWLECTSDRELIGYRRSTGWANDQHIYFVAQFSKPFSRFGNIANPSDFARRIAGTDVGGFVQYATNSGDQIMIRVGISSVDIEGARKNLQEVPHWDFEKVRKAAEALWSQALGKINIEGGTERQRRTFTTALYHTMIAPNLASDVDGRYRGMDHVIRKASGFTMYTVFSLWDTFRALHPLLTILEPHRTRDFIRSLLAKYDEGGALPVWELASNETWTMIGYHSIPVIVDAYVKGIRDFDANHALQAMKRSAGADRSGLRWYREYGFIPGDREGESVSKTLEYSYDDWCIAEFARLLGKQDVERLFAERSQFYRNLFDASTGFMRARVNAHWVEPFDPSSVSVHYTEANAWQYSLFAPHDPQGLISLLGGKAKLEQKLDSMFFGATELTGRKQSDITGLIGQYAQGNEPSHHVAFLYNYTHSPWKTQYLTRRILDSLFSDKADGLCGNDDCGQMSAWYVLNALGFYPVTPGTPDYHLTSPLFPSATIDLADGKRFTVKTRGSGLYIRTLRKNDVPAGELLVSHAEIVSGSTLEIELGAEPSGERFHLTRIPAPSGQPITRAPVLESTGSSFEDSVQVVVRNTEPGATIYYAISPDTTVQQYRRPFVISRNAVVRVHATKEGYYPSRTVVSVFTKTGFAGTVRLETAYSNQYTGGGDQSLRDGVRGGTDFRLGAWQGYEGNDLIAVINLGAMQDVRSVGLSCLQDENSWIFFPLSVEFSFSEDGTTFANSTTVRNDVPLNKEGALLKEFTVQGSRARFVKVRAQNVKICPPWHKGAGEKAWLFVDEIIIH